MSLDISFDLDFETAAGALEHHVFRYARTMPQCPHWYTLRKTWADGERGAGELFERVVMYIRAHGYREQFGKSTFVRFDVNGMKYWTMGAKLHRYTEDGFEPVTILINRALIDRLEPYDQIALIYDGLHNSPESLAESRSVVEAIGYQGGDVLDVGCGTGLLLDHLRPDGYVGIDPSFAMLQEFERKHGTGKVTPFGDSRVNPKDGILQDLELRYPGATLVHAGLERFHTERRFGLVVGLFGSASYIKDEVLQRIPGFLVAGGRAHLMFYAPGYEPITYRRSGITVPHIVRSSSHIAGLFGGKVTHEGNYLILRWQK